ncbi:hypothetical protein BXY64_3225 [Marinifilum flexuosum]|uniref:Uncharacterized protein n=1 Tax=Marinifilum flexuosum TaxID=1117708 RepID=A0A419WXP9_9BACT|nr:hypothetical protein BXY64_3225 [Marinifilum flexuosum]
MLLRLKIKAKLIKFKTKGLIVDDKPIKFKLQDLKINIKLMLFSKKGMNFNPQPIKNSKIPLPKAKNYS